MFETGFGNLYNIVKWVGLCSLTSIKDAHPNLAHCPIWMADKPHVQSMALKILSRDITLAFIRNRKEQAQGVWLGTFIHNNPPGCNVPIWCSSGRPGQPARLRGGQLLPYMAGEGGRGGPAEVEKNLSTPYPNFESRHPLARTWLIAFDRVCDCVRLRSAFDHATTRLNGSRPRLSGPQDPLAMATLPDGTR